MSLKGYPQCVTVKMYQVINSVVVQVWMASLQILFIECRKAAALPETCIYKQGG